MSNHDANSARAWPFTWVGLLALAWVLFELTHSPALASIVICLKFGWEDFRSAIWLQRRDPLHARGLALLLLHVGWGLWKTAVVAFIMCVAFAGLVPLQGNVQPLRAFAGTLLTTIAGFFLTILLTLFSLLVAVFSNHRLWLSAGIHRARRLAFWPPTPFCLDQRNRLPLLLLTMLGLPCLVVVLVLIVAIEENILESITGLCALCLPVLIVGARYWLTALVQAEKPEECWPEEWDPEQRAADSPQMR